jgi:hypothetical protein
MEKAEEYKVSKKMNIYQRMSAVTNELGRVAKNLKVEVSKTNAYKAVSEADILDAVKPAEEKFGVYSYPVERAIIESGTLESETKYGTRKQLYMRVEVQYRFVNVDNPEEYIDITSYGDGIDTADKAPGKAMTYADKYALMKAYKISTGDDPDQTASEPLKNAPNEEQKQAKQAEVKKIDETKLQSIQAEIDRTGVKTENICKTYKVNSLKELNLQQWADAMNKFAKVKDKPKMDLGL